MPGRVMESLFDLGIGLNGWIAMAIAVVGIVALNVGLMRLMRRPHREYDPEIDDPLRPKPPPGEDP
jgi:hypothetical protein